MSINAHNKGKAGEYEFIQRFQPFFPNTLERNIEQVRKGGSDIIGSEPFVVEIKRCEKIELNKWWKQVTKAVTNEWDIPTIAYRQNRQNWKFLLPSRLIGIEHDGYIECDEDVWLRFVMRNLESLGSS